MRRSLIALAAAAAVTVGGVTAAARMADPVEAAETAGPVLIITGGAGQGSGVSIGEGFILTAAHVVGPEAKELTLKDDAGNEQKAEVLWVNEAYDLALLKAENPSILGVSVLSCRAVSEGESLLARGSPLGTEFISFRGHVAGVERNYGRWQSAIVMDISGGPGISGGPVYDAKGNVIALFVGARLAPVGIGASYVGMSVGVPSTAACMLMGRSA